MLNEDQASCEKLFVKKPSSKHRNATLQEDNGVSRGDAPEHHWPRDETSGLKTHILVVISD